MIITNCKEKDINLIRKLWDECFDEDSAEWRNWYFNNIFNVNNVISAREKGELISMIHMNPYLLMLRNAKINAYSLSGVATQEKNRGHGFAGNLIKYSLKKAYNMGYDFSFLYPFKYEYYERFGYKLSYNKYSYLRKIFQNRKDAEITVHKMYDTSVLASIYRKFIKNLNGFVLRDKSYYDIHIKELLCDGKEIICFSINDKLGYFSIDKERKKIDEMAFEGNMPTALESITTLYNTDLEFENLYNIVDILGASSPHCMGRVISVKGMFSKMKLKNIDIKIEITDDIITENNSVWHVWNINGKSKIEKTLDKADYRIDISKLAPIITGFDLNEESIDYELQNLLFHKTTPFIYEVC